MGRNKHKGASKPPRNKSTAGRPGHQVLSDDDGCCAAPALAPHNAPPKKDNLDGSQAAISAPPQPHINPLTSTSDCGDSAGVAMLSKGATEKDDLGAKSDSSSPELTASPTTINGSTMGDSAISGSTGEEAESAVKPVETSSSSSLSSLQGGVRAEEHPQAALSMTEIEDVKRGIIFQLKSVMDLVVDKMPSSDKNGKHLLRSNLAKQLRAMRTEIEVLTKDRNVLRGKLEKSTSLVGAELKTLEFPMDVAADMINMDIVTADEDSQAVLSVSDVEKVKLDIMLNMKFALDLVVDKMPSNEKSGKDVFVGTLVKQLRAKRSEIELLTKDCSELKGRLERSTSSMAAELKKLDEAAGRSKEEVTAEKDPQAVLSESEIEEVKQGFLSELKSFLNVVVDEMPSSEKRGKKVLRSNLAKQVRAMRSEVEFLTKDWNELRGKLEKGTLPVDADLHPRNVEVESEQKIGSMTCNGECFKGEAERVKLKKRVEEVERKKKELRDEVSELRGQVGRLKCERDEIGVDRDALRVEVGHLKEEVVEAKRGRGKEEEDICWLQAQVEETEKKMEVLVREREKRDVEWRLVEEERDKLWNLVADLKGQIAAPAVGRKQPWKLDEVVAELRRQRDDAYRDRSQLRETVKQLKRDDRIATDIQDLKSAISDLEKVNEDLRRKSACASAGGLLPLQAYPSNSRRLLSQAGEKTDLFCWWSGTTMLAGVATTMYLLSMFLTMYACKK